MPALIADDPVRSDTLRSKASVWRILIPILILVAGCVQLVMGAYVVGITIDEPTHVNRMQSWIDHGIYVPDFLHVDGDPDPSTARSTTYVYGPATSLIAHSFNVLAGNEAAGEMSDDLAAYRVRHLTTAALGLIGVAAVGLAGFMLTGSKPVGLWTAATLVAIPSWIGHAFFNIKDVPTAVGYTLVTTGAIVALCSRFARTRAKSAALLVTFLVAFGFFIGVGTRSAMWAPLGASVLTWLIIEMRLGKRHGRPTPWMFSAVPVGAVVGLALVAVSYPHNAARPLEWAMGSVSGSAGYLSAPTLMAGIRVIDPWWYLPTWVFARLPLIIGACAFLGLATAIRHALGSRDSGDSGSQPEAKEARSLAGLLFVQQAALLPILTTVAGSTMYDGLRQHLYVVPALAVLAAIGGKRIYDRARVGSRPVRIACAALLTVGLVVPMVEQARLFPYNYTYVNPIAGAGGVEDRWESDYWYASAPEAIAAVPSEGELACVYDIVLPGVEDPQFEPIDCARKEFNPYLDRRGTAARSISPAPTEKWVITWRRLGNLVPSYCEVVDRVERPLRFENVTMSMVLRCDAALLGEVQG